MMKNMLISTTKSKGKTHRIRRLLTRFSLVWVVVVAAIAISAVLLQGRSWIATLKGTPLPSFYLEDSLTEKPLPEKTKVYQRSLSALPTTRYSGVDKRQALSKPAAWWHQPVNQTGTTNPDSVVKAENQFVADKQAPTSIKTRKATSRRRRVAKSKDVVKADTLPLSLFQTAKAQALTASLVGKAGKQFIACQVHGDQELSNQQRLVLRLSEELKLDHRSFPAGTLLYGSMQFSMNRIQVIISRIAEHAVSFRVHDHTYHEGILLQQKDQRIEQATTVAALQQAGQSVQQLPSRAGIILSQNLLNAARRRPNTVFLPDGFPLFIAPIKINTTP